MEPIKSCSNVSGILNREDLTLLVNSYLSIDNDEKLNILDACLGFVGFNYKNKIFIYSQEINEEYSN